jgi:hypothetical protein
MKIEHSDTHTVDFLDEAGMAFMALTVHRLNDALKRHGIGDSEVRQEICASFLFEFAYQHDAGWILHQGQKLFPMVVFATREKSSPDENLGTIAELHVPTDTSSWHEYAHGVVSQYFEDDEETLADLQTGS